MIVSLRKMLSRRFLVALCGLVFALGVSMEGLANTQDTQVLIQPVALTAEVSTLTVSIAGAQMIGDPSTLSTINKLNLSGHNIEVSRWKSASGLDVVMQQLALQVPQETLAWSETGVIYLHWTTTHQSHFLMVEPINDRTVEFTVSSIDVFQHHHSRLEKNNTFRDQDTYREIKSFFNLHFINAKLLLDVKDHAADADSFTLLFELEQNLFWVEGELKDLLKSAGWHLTGEIQPARVSNTPRAFEATRYQQQLRIDLVTKFSKTFVHIHQIGSHGLERNKRTN